MRANGGMCMCMYELMQISTGQRLTVLRLGAIPVFNAMSNSVRTPSSLLCTYQLKPPPPPHPGEVWGTSLGVEKKCDNAPYTWAQFSF